MGVDNVGRFPHVNLVIQSFPMGETQINCAAPARADDECLVDVDDVDDVGETQINYAALARADDECLGTSSDCEIDPS